MSVGSALKHYYEYKKTVFLTLVVGIGLIILVIAGALWYIFVGAPTWNTFAENFVGFFTNWGTNITLSAADIQTYLIEHWVDIILFITFFGGLGGLIYVLAVKHGRRHKILGAAVCLGIMVFSGLATISQMAVSGELQINPHTGTISAPESTHYYVLIQYRGVWRDGWWWNEAALDTKSCTITRQTTIGELTSLRWQITYQDWLECSQEPVALAKVFVKIAYTNGEDTGWIEIFGGDFNNGNFNFNLRIDTPTGLTPKTVYFKITELDYTWLVHHGYVTVYSTSQTF